MENEEWRTRNGERGMKNGEWEIENGEWGTRNRKWRTRNRKWWEENGERGMGNEKVKLEITFKKIFFLCGNFLFIIPPVYFHELTGVMGSWNLPLQIILRGTETWSWLHYQNSSLWNFNGFSFFPSRLCVLGASGSDGVISTLLTFKCICLLVIRTESKISIQSNLHAAVVNHT